MNVKNQIENLLQNKAKRDEIICDIQLRIEHQHDPLIEISGKINLSHKTISTLSGTQYNLSLQTNTDGIQLYVSSTKSLCPTLLLIKSINYRYRHTYVFIPIIWSVEGKPSLCFYTIR